MFVEERRQGFGEHAFMDFDVSRQTPGATGKCAAFLGCAGPVFGQTEKGIETVNGSAGQPGQQPDTVAPRHAEFGNQAVTAGMVQGVFEQRLPVAADHTMPHVAVDVFQCLAPGLQLQFQQQVAGIEFMHEAQVEAFPQIAEGIFHQPRASSYKARVLSSIRSRVKFRLGAMCGRVLRKSRTFPAAAAVLPGSTRPSGCNSSSTSSAPPWA